MPTRLKRVNLFLHSARDLPAVLFIRSLNEVIDQQGQVLDAFPERRKVRRSGAAAFQGCDRAESSERRSGRCWRPRNVSSFNR